MTVFKLKPIFLKKTNFEVGQKLNRRDKHYVVLVSLFVSEKIPFVCIISKEWH